MIDFETATKGDHNKFIDHFPQNGDLTLQVLKGHLLLEELLREIFLMQLPLPSALSGNKGTSFECHQIICLIEAMTPHSQTVPWIWVAAKKLNNVRNELAHRLNPKGLESKVADLVKYVKSESPEISDAESALGIPKGNEFTVVIVAMCSCLASLKPVLEQHVKTTGKRA
ncbi:MAG: hypothetical protein IPN63_15165 [Gammaproteobacteria bacterium]|mgnify:CR=1 FL=1|nr:hypothetical protein [Gammaproteobacteria bacterium]MBK8132879.1 hypothetical protein [Gammaproteobacteria bacterium]MBK9428665.1 hypothetical protein [Gammaproteobacteria bacterium]